VTHILYFLNDSACPFLLGEREQDVQYKMRCKDNDDSKENSGRHVVKLLAFLGSSSELHEKRVPGWLDYVGDDKLPIILPSYIGIYFITHGSLLILLTKQYSMAHLRLFRWCPF